MKQKDIEKKLKTEAEQFAPDLLDKIKSAARGENLLPYVSENNSEEYSQGNTAVMAKSKRKAIGWFSCVAVIVCLVLILSFIFYFGRNKPFNPAHIHLSAEDVYGMGAVSSVRLLGSNMSVSAVKTFSEVRAVAQRRSSDGMFTSNSSDDSEREVKEQAERFNEYFTALDSFFGKDIISTTTEENADGKYPYEIKMTIKGTDLSGKTIPYIMYYTEFLVNSQEDEEEADEDGETEREYKLVGVMVVDGAEYYLEGERSEENEKDESETELKIRAYADMADKSSYIQMEQEYSVEDGETETEYVYSIYVNGELLEQTAVEFETENKDGKVETEYELEFRSGASKGKYVVEREVKDNKTEIKVKYDIDGKKGVFHIREITDEDGNKKYEYKFSDNEIKIF